MEIPPAPGRGGGRGVGPGQGVGRVLLVEHVRGVVGLGGRPPPDGGVRPHLPRRPPEAGSVVVGVRALREPDVLVLRRLLGLSRGVRLRREPDASVRLLQRHAGGVRHHHPLVRDDLRLGRLAVVVVSGARVARRPGRGGTRQPLRRGGSVSHFTEAFIVFGRIRSVPGGRLGRVRRVPRGLLGRGFRRIPGGRLRRVRRVPRGLVGRRIRRDVRGRGTLPVHFFTLSLGHWRRERRHRHESGLLRHRRWFTGNYDDERFVRRLWRVLWCAVLLTERLIPQHHRRLVEFGRLVLPPRLCRGLQLRVGLPLRARRLRRVDSCGLCGLRCGRLLHRRRRRIRRRGRRLWRRGTRARRYLHNLISNDGW